MPDDLRRPLRRRLSVTGRERSRGSAFMAKRKKRTPRNNSKGQSRKKSRGMSLILQQFFDRLVEELYRRPRLIAWVNLGAIYLIGWGIGLFIGLTVVLGTGKLPAPWVYISNLTLAVIVKIAAAWLVALALNPLVAAMAFRTVMRRTGTRIPERLKPELKENQLTGMVATVVVSCTVLATILATQEVEPKWLKGPGTAIPIVATAGALVATAEALCNPYAILALVKNRIPLFARSRGG